MNFQPAKKCIAKAWTHAVHIIHFLQAGSAHHPAISSTVTLAPGRGVDPVIAPLPDVGLSSSRMDAHAHLGIHRDTAGVTLPESARDGFAHRPYTGLNTQFVPREAGYEYNEHVALEYLEDISETTAERRPALCDDPFAFLSGRFCFEEQYFEHTSFRASPKRTSQSRSCEFACRGEVLQLDLCHQYPSSGKWTSI